MKRQGRKSKSSLASTNGVSSKDDENGRYSDLEERLPEEPSPKKKKGNKRGKGSPTKQAEKQAEKETEEPQYEVEKILDEKNIRGVRHYLIRWKGYEPESDTWEPESTLNCAELITEFKAKQKKKKRGRPAKSSKSLDGAEQEDWDENDDFEVDRILEVHFRKDGKREFLVSWKGYPSSQNTWEPEEHMDCKELISKFMSKVEKAKVVDLRELRTCRPHTDRFTLTMGSKGRRISKRNSGKQRVHYHDAE